MIMFSHMIILVTRNDSQPDNKRVRVTKKSAALQPGLDDEGNPLPTSDATGYSPVQKYVFDKIFSNLPEVARQTYKELEAKKDI